MMVDLKDLSLFTSKLMVAEGGEEMVETLKTKWKSFDFKKVITDHGSFVEVTENSGKKFKVFLTSESVPEIIKTLVDIDEKFSEGNAVPPSELN